MPFISESASWGLTEYISAGGFQTLEELFEYVAFGMQSSIFRIFGFFIMLIEE